MATYVGASEAARILGVSRATLYAYVSRGTIDRRTAPDGRTSLYALDDLEAHVARTARGRRRPVAPRPSIDVQISSSVTTLDEDGPRYRGHDVGELGRTATFEQVAELLWSGRLPPGAPLWPSPDPADVDVAADVAIHSTGDALADLAILATRLGVHLGHQPPDAAARRFLGLTPIVLGDPGATDGPFATRLMRRWHPEPTPTHRAAIECALVTLADHELATSTLAVRLAGSVRADPFTSFASGFAVLRAPLHGSASDAAVDMLTACESDGITATIRRSIEGGGRLPGFGHRIYRRRDPRLGALLDAVRELPDPDHRLAVVDGLLEQAGRVLTVEPNVDLGLAALTYVGGFPRDIPLFAIARVVGWAAHLAEELHEQPVRFRGMARMSEPRL